MTTESIPSSSGSGASVHKAPETGKGVSGVTASGIFADHPPRVLLPAKVAPTLEKEFNTLRDPLITVACASMPDYLFDFDRSFIKPDVQSSGFISGLAGVRKRHPNSPLSVFGHADPTGNDDYNAHLSGRRAAASYGLLTRNVELWDDIYQNAGQLTQPCAGDQWGPRSFQYMLSIVPDTAGTPYYSGDFDDTWNPALNDALSRFTKDKGTPPGQARRKAIYKLYMELVCVETENGQNKAFQLDPAEFLAQGKGVKGKGDFQGCGESNPQMVFSKSEAAFFKAHPDKHTKEQRDKENQPNRRVIVLFFREGTRIDPTKWVCPNVHEAGAHSVCQKRYWHNGETRRNPQEERREFKNTRDTFACRFYHGLTYGSPCEQTLEMWNLRVLYRAPLRLEGGSDDDEMLLPFANRRYVLLMSQNPEGAQIRGATDADGRVAIPVMNETANDKPRITLKVDFNWFDDNPKYFQPKPPAAKKSPDAASSDKSGAKSEADPPDPNAPAPDANDPNAPYPDEDRFLVLTLDAGDLLVVDAPDLEPGGLSKAQRLSNLAYLVMPGDPDGKDKATEAAAEKRFQRDQELAADAPDDAMRAQLKKVHGG